MQLAASLQQSHLIKASRSQPAGLLSEQLARAPACRTGLLVQGSNVPTSALSGEELSPVSDVIDGVGSQQGSFWQPHLYLDLQHFPFSYSFTHLLSPAS